MKENRKAFHDYILIFIAGALWGFIGMFVKELQLAGSTPELTGFLRMVFSFVIMFVVCLTKGGLKSMKVDLRTLLTCALLGLICHGIYNVFYSLSVTTVGVSVSAVLLNIAPVFTMIFSAVLFSEKVTGIKVIAVIINVAGCILTATNGQFDLLSLSLVGILFGVGAGICYSLTAVIGRLAAGKTDPFIMSMYSYLFAAVFLWLWMSPWHGNLHFTGKILVWGFLYALIPTALAYVIYYKGLQRVTESSKVPVIASVEAVVATVLGVVIYKEQLGVGCILGMVLVFVSIFVMNCIGKIR